MKKKYLILAAAIIIITALAGVAVAAFGDKGQVLGSSFTMGSADIKFLKNLTGGVDPVNLTDELPGPTFTGIMPNWSKDYLIKIYNNTTTHVQLTSNANYETINDPDDLRSIIFIEPINWNDANNNGQLDSGELGSSFGRKTITKWKTEGYDLSSLAPGGVKGIVLRFSTDAVSDTKQGKTGMFDFIFDSASIAN